MLTQSNSHLVVVRLRVDRPVTAAQARYAVWNAIHDMVIYGVGDSTEPWGAGRIRVPRRPPPGRGLSTKGGRR